MMVQEDSYKSGSVQYIDSREVAEMVGKRHPDLKRDIKRYISQLDMSKIAHIDFFVDNTYYDSGNREQSCYLITLKGCEFIAHKLTGQKGTEFTARYINRFHEMEDALAGDTSSVDALADTVKGYMLYQEKRNDEQVDFMRRQTEFNKMIIEFMQAFSKDHGKLLTAGESHNPFNPGKSVLKERMDTLNSLVDQTAELCGLERNKLLHYMYQTIQEDMKINLKSYLNVYQTEMNDDSISNFHLICSIDKLYEKAVEMNQDVIQRKKVYG